MSDLDEDETLPFAQHIGDLIYQGSQLVEHRSPDSIRAIPTAMRPFAVREGWQLYGLLFGQLLDALRYAQKSGIGEGLVIAELQDAATNAVGLMAAQFEDDEPGSVLSAHLLSAMAAMSQNRKRNSKHEPVLLRARPRAASEAIEGDMRAQVARGFAIAAMRVLLDMSIVGGTRRPSETPTRIAVANILAGGTIELSLRARRDDAGAEAPITEQAVRGWIERPSKWDCELADHMENEIRQLIASNRNSPPLSLVGQYAESLAALRKV